MSDMPQSVHKKPRWQRFTEACVYMMIGASIALFLALLARECPNAMF